MKRLYRLVEYRMVKFGQGQASADVESLREIRDRMNKNPEGIKYVLEEADDDEQEAIERNTNIHE